MKLELNTKYGLFNKKEKKIAHKKFIKALIKAVEINTKDNPVIDMFERGNIKAYILNYKKHIPYGVILQVSLGDYITTSYDTNNMSLLAKMKDYNDKQAKTLHDEHHSSSLDLAKIVQ